MKYHAAAGLFSTSAAFFFDKPAMEDKIVGTSCRSKWFGAIHGPSRFESPPDVNRIWSTLEMIIEMGYF